jgi:hypothetical protein
LHANGEEACGTVNALQEYKIPWLGSGVRSAPSTNLSPDEITVMNPSRRKLESDFADFMDLLHGKEEDPCEIDHFCPRSSLAPSCAIQTNSHPLLLLAPSLLIIGILVIIPHAIYAKPLV